MVKVCQTNDILTHMQFDLRSKISCLEAIAKVTEFMRRESDHKEMSRACFLDPSQVTDTLDHKVSLTKTENYAFRAKVLKL